jgi:hypothetical protein
LDTALLLKELQTKSSFPSGDFPAFLDLFEQLLVKKKDHLYRSGEIVRNVAFVLKGCLRHYYINEESIERITMFAAWQRTDNRQSAGTSIRVMP